MTQIKAQDSMNEGPPATELTSSMVLHDPLYKPLNRDTDSLRLLSILPVVINEDENVVRCSLHCTSFAEIPSYEALSYTWGDPTQQQEIVVNNIKVLVGENLYSALKALRTTENRVIWADAICINQRDNDERTYQVALMDFIYEQAFCVVVWLGYQEFEYQNFEYQPFRYQSFDDRGLDEDGDEYYDQAQREATNLWPKDIIQFSNWVNLHKYWTRLWIIQEIALARELKVQIGDTSMEWSNLLQIVERAPKHKSSKKQKKKNKVGGALLVDGAQLEKLNNLRRARHSAENRLENLLVKFQDAHCGEKRDKVYGLLGLASDCQHFTYIQPDYTKTMHELHAEVMCTFFRPDVLENGISNAMDRSMRGVAYSQTIWKLLMDSETPISHDAVILDLASSLGKIVRVRAAVLCEVVLTGPTRNEIISSSRKNKEWKSKFASCYTFSKDLEVLRARHSEYGYVLRAMAMSETEKFTWSGVRPDQARGIRCKQMWILDSQRWAIQDPLADNPSLETWDQQSIGQRYPPLKPDSRLFLGKKRFMGMASADIMEGDLICQFWDTDVIVLLRRVGTTGHYQLAGRAHLFEDNVDGRLATLGVKNDQEDLDCMAIDMTIRTLQFLTGSC